MPEPLSLCVDGVIGVGKTTLAGALAAHLGAVRLFEQDIDKPFLADFYRHPKRWALTCQLAFLEGRVRQLGQEGHEGLSRIADHSLEKDAIFAAINLSGPERALYTRFYQRLAPLVRFRPAVWIYLKASLPTLIERLRRRRDPQDGAIPIDYLGDLITAYDQFFLGEEAAPRRLIVVDLDHCDISNEPASLSHLLRICQAAPHGVTYYNPFASTS